MSSLAENVLAVGAENRPPMLEKVPFEYKVVTFLANEATRRQAETRMQTFKDLTPEEKIRKECDIQDSNIILHGLPNDIYVDIKVCESFRLIFLDVIPIFILEYEHVAMNLTLLERGRFIKGTSLTGFPAQSVRSSNADALDSLYLLVSLYRTPQSRLPH
uniref:Uncharacterized protein n=1 Tax=Tanacetum cinerariifolium TaxID=118510 RepID=A0A699GHE9_TANCI|nr:hypothetical protein [Tanacetum cinerariifolium]